MKGRKAANLKVVADNTPKMTDNGGLPQCPSYLSILEISDEWDAAIKKLSDDGRLSNEVLPTVEAYVTAIWCQRQALKKVVQDGVTFSIKGEIKKNPAVATLNDAREEFLRLARELCLTPASQAAQPNSSQNQPTGQDKPDDGAPPGLVV